MRRVALTRWSPNETSFAFDDEVLLRSSYYGLCHHDDRKLEISTKAKEDGVYRETVVHELLHAIFPSWSEEAVLAAGVVIDHALRYRDAGTHRRSVIDRALASVAPHLSKTARASAARDIARVVKDLGV